MIYLSRLLFIGILLISFGCKKENNTGLPEETQIQQLDSLSEEKTLLELLKLSAEAEKDLESFEDFQNFRNIIVSMHNANPFYVKKYADSADVLLQTFEENLSEDLNVNTINSRITVLSTELGLLKEISAKKTPDAKAIMDYNTKLMTAYNSLIIQLNELSLAIPENIEKELLKELENTEE